MNTRSFFLKNLNINHSTTHINISQALLSLFASTISTLQIFYRQFYSYVNFFCLLLQSRDIYQMVIGTYIYMCWYINKMDIDCIIELMLYHYSISSSTQIYLVRCDHKICKIALIQHCFLAKNWYMHVCLSHEWWKKLYISLYNLRHCSIFFSSL